MIDYPPVSLELANWISQHTGRELADVAQTADVGPTGVSTTNPGDFLADLGVQTVRAVPYWVEWSLLIKASVANELVFLLLYDGIPSTPGTQIAFAPLYCPVAPPHLVTGRWRFTPAAGSRGYHLRWRNGGAAGTLYTIQNTLYVSHYTMKEVAK